MTHQSKGTQNLDTYVGLAIVGSLKGGQVETNVSSDSRSISAGIIVGQDMTSVHETNVIPNQLTLTTNPYDSQQTEGSGSIRPVGDTGGPHGLVDIMNTIRNLPANTNISSITLGTHTADELTTRIYGGGSGRNIGPMQANLLAAKEINEIGLLARGHLDDQTSDDSFYKKCLSSKNPCYKLENKSAALIINNIFDDNPDDEYKKKYRDGAEKDATKMKELFTKCLQFSFARTKTNVCSEDLPRILETFRADVKRNKCSSCFIIIMSHGGKAVNSILMDDMKDVDLYNDIVYKFSDHDDVRAMPKVFLVQACRNSEGPPLSNGPEKLKGIQDILIGHATSPHFPAGRNNLTGSLYIDIIDQVFRLKAEKSTLYNMLMEVGQDKRLKEHGQYPTVELSGFREYAFNISFKTAKN